MLETEGRTRMATYRVVFKTKTGKVEQKDFKDVDSLLNAYEQTAVEEDSYTLRLHGEPVLKGLVGPISDGKHVVRYETPEVYAELTEQWAKNLKKSRLNGNGDD